MSAEILEPVVTVTRYEVSCLPTDHVGYRRSVVTIENRATGRTLPGAEPTEYVWAVMLDGWAYSDADTASIEPVPSERSAAYLRRHRHDLATATEIAEAVARAIAAHLTGGAR